MNQNQTAFFYIALFLIVFIFACLSQYNKKDKGINLFPFILSFLSLLFAIVFTDIGPDYESYSLIISRIRWDNFASFYDQEPVFNFILLCIKTVCKENIDLTIAIIKIVTLVLVFCSFYIARGRINIGISVLCYCLLYYLESFYLFPMILATSLSLLAFSIYREKNIVFVPLILIFFAAQFHNSAYFLLLIFIFIIIFRNSSYFSPLKRMMLILVYIFAGFGASYIFQLASELIPNFHYGSYVGNFATNSGMLFFLIYIPIFGLYYLFFSKVKDYRYKTAIFVLIASSALFKFLSYSFYVIGRVEYLFAPLFCLYISELFRKDTPVMVSKSQLQVLLSITMLYILFRGYLNVSSEMQWVGEYNFFNPFI